MKTHINIIRSFAAMVTIVLLAVAPQIALSQSSGKVSNLSHDVSIGPYSDTRNEFTIYIGYDPEQVQLNATRGVRYMWTPTDGLSNPTVPNPIARPSRTTTYTVAITDHMGNIHLQRFLVNVIDVRCGRGEGFVEMCYAPPGTHGIREICVDRNKVRELLIQGYRLGDCDLTGGNFEGDIKSTSENILIDVNQDPFNADTRIDLTLASNANLTMEVTDLYGRQIGNIFKGSLRAGQHTFNWENNQMAMAQTVYFLRVVSDTDSKTIKLVRE